MRVARMTVRMTFAVLLLTAARPAGACICYESKGLEADYREAEAVFAGKVVALQIVNTTVAGNVEEEMVATVRVERLWKGPKDHEIQVRTCGTQQTICTCGTAFRLGEYFVVFAVGKPLATGSCQRTRRYDRIPEAGLLWNGAEDLVRELDALNPGARQPSGPDRD